MDVSISTLAIVILVASAASIASYWISQWSPLRDRGRVSWWIGISIGVGLLIAAAAIAILSLRLPASLQMPAVTQLFDAIDAEAVEPTDTTMPSADPQDGNSRPTVTASAQSISAVPTKRMVTTLADPWRATECVWAWRPDLTNETRWLVPGIGTKHPIMLQAPS